MDLLDRRFLCTSVWVSERRTTETVNDCSLAVKIAVKILYSNLQTNRSSKALPSPIA